MEKISLASSFGKLTVDERKIIVGIDFGTTFSGLARAERKRVCDDRFELKYNLADNLQKDQFR